MSCMVYSVASVTKCFFLMSMVLETSLLVVELVELVAVLMKLVAVLLKTVAVLTIMAVVAKMAVVLLETPLQMKTFVLKVLYLGLLAQMPL